MISTTPFYIFFSSLIQTVTSTDINLNSRILSNLKENPSEN